MDKVVLPEEEFEEALEAIIDRDFFPDKKRLRRALDEPEIQRDAPNQTLDEFVNTHTTEDDYAFEQILKREEEKRRAKLQWMEDRASRHNALQAEIKRTLEWANSQQLEGLLLGGALADKVETAKRLAGLLSCPGEARPALMFPPEAPAGPVLAIEDAHSSSGHKVYPSRTRLRGIDVEAEARKAQECQEAQKLRAEREREASLAVETGDFRKVYGRIEQTPVLSPYEIVIYTWGRIVETPVFRSIRDDGGEEDDPHVPSTQLPDKGPTENLGFDLQGPSEREVAANALADLRTKKHRQMKSQASSIREELRLIAATPKMSGPGTPAPGGIFASSKRAKRGILDTPLGKAMTAFAQTPKATQRLL